MDARINLLTGSEIKIGVALCIIDRQEGENIICKAKWMNYELNCEPKDFWYWQNKK